MIKKILLTLLVLLLIVVPVCADSVNGSVRIRTDGGGGGGGGGSGDYGPPPAQNQTVFISYPLNTPYVPRPQPEQQEVQQTQPAENEVPDVTGAATTTTEEAVPLSFSSLTILGILFMIMLLYFHKDIESKLRRIRR